MKSKRVARLLDNLHAGEFTATKLLRRPETTWEDVRLMFPDLSSVSAEVAWQVSCDVKYAGYISRQDIDVARQTRLAEKRIPDNINYEDISQLRCEAREKLAKIRPTNLAQAGRISGITPTDVALVMTHLKGKRS